MPGHRVLRSSALSCALTLLMLAGCASAHVAPLQAVGGGAPGQPAARPVPPPVILVADFELEAADVHSEPGLIPHPVLGRVGGRLRGQSACAANDAAGCAQEVRELLATSLVEDLQKAGLNARRLAPGETLPAGGWLVRGVFTDVDTGNRLRRAVVGFGSGATQMQLVLAIDDLSSGAPRPLYQTDAEASSGRAPGGIVLMNPAMMAARFVMSRKDVDKNAKKLAQQVSDTVAARAKGTAAG